MTIPGAIATFITALPFVSALSDWFGRRSVTLDANISASTQRIIQWGQLVGMDGTSIDYFAIILPSWCWEYDLLSMRECWHRRELWWTPRRGWRMILQAERNTE